MKKQSCDTSLAPSKLVVRSDSHTICKQKPKIRIIHVVSPEIINTDVENFRELVQRLTGKSNSSGTIKKGKNVRSMQKKKTQSGILQKGSENSNNLLSFLGDVEGFMHGVNHEFRPLLQFSSSQINTFGEMRL